MGVHAQRVSILFFCIHNLFSFSVYMLSEPIIIPLNFELCLSVKSHLTSGVSVRP